MGAIQKLEKRTELIYLPIHVGFSMHLFLQPWLPMSISLKTHLKLLKNMGVLMGKGLSPSLSKLLDVREF